MAVAAGTRIDSTRNKCAKRHVCPKWEARMRVSNCRKLASAEHAYQCGFTISDQGLAKFSSMEVAAGTRINSLLKKRARLHAYQHIGGESSAAKTQTLDSATGVPDGILILHWTPASNFPSANARVLLTGFQHVCSA